MNYDKLYELAFEYKKTKLWEQVSDSEIFAVKMTDGKIGYVTIMGMAGQVYMLALYIGEEGFQSLLRIMYDDTYYMSPFEQRDFALSQSCLQCAFETKEYIGEDEAEIVKKYAKKHKIKLSGKNTYPFFWKYYPYRVPWKIESEDDAEYLCEALSAAIEISKLLKNKEKSDIGLKTLNKRVKKIIMLEQTDNGYVISKTEVPKRTTTKYPEPKCNNELGIAKLKRFENKVDFECEIVRHFEPALDDESDIFAFPVILFALNPQSDFLLPVEPVMSYEENPDKLMNSFINTLIKFELCPSSIRVVDKQTYAFAKPFCEKLGIEIELAAERSDIMAEVQDEFLNELGISDDYDESDLSFEDEEKLEELLENLMGFSEGKMNKNEFFDYLGSFGREIPAELIEAFEEVESRNKNHNSDNVISIDDKRRSLDNKNSNQSYVISVSVSKGCYRHIKISGNSTLDDLHFAINDAFEFDDEHLHAFFMDNRPWQGEVYYDARTEDAELFTSDVTLGNLGLTVGKKFKYIFDFGDEWIFQCKVLKILNEPDAETCIIKSVGEPPVQYPEWDEDFFEDDDFGSDILPQ